VVRLYYYGMRDIRVAAVQFQHAPGDKDYNLGRVRYFATDAARQGVEIVAFPEMCLTGYWHTRKLDRERFTALAECVPDGPSTHELLELSRELGVSIGAAEAARQLDRVLTLARDTVAQDLQLTIPPVPATLERWS